MEPLLYKRIDMVKRAMKLTHQMLADEAGMSRHTVQAQLCGKRAVDVELVIALVRICPSLNAGWLLTGTRTNGNYTPEPEESTEQVVKKLTEKIRDLEQKVHDLEAQ